MMSMLLEIYENKNKMNFSTSGVNLQQG